MARESSGLCAYLFLVLVAPHLVRAAGKIKLWAGSSDRCGGVKALVVGRCGSKIGIEIGRMAVDGCG